jgi:hypothetical protein
MLSISKCITIAIAVATVVVNTLQSNKNNPLDLNNEI